VQVLRADRENMIHSATEGDTSTSAAAGRGAGGGFANSGVPRLSAENPRRRQPQTALIGPEQSRLTSAAGLMGWTKERLVRYGR
jgi:hypothetical protein